MTSGQPEPWEPKRETLQGYKPLPPLPPHTHSAHDEQQPCIACEQLLKEACGLTDVAQAEALSLYL